MFTCHRVRRALETGFRRCNENSALHMTDINICPTSSENDNINSNTNERISDSQLSFALFEQRVSHVEEDLAEDEKTFLRLVKVGDIDGIKALLEDNENLNVDCCDYRGQRALDIAIGSHDTDLVEFLLSGLNVSILHYYCAILKAVFENEEKILQMLLDGATKTDSIRTQLKELIGGGNDCSSCLPEVGATNMTPIMAAAYKGNIKVTRMFLERGYIIQKPHKPKCCCQDRCYSKRDKGGESLTESIKRMNAYRGLTSPTYIILTANDPVLCVFELVREIEKLSKELPENRKEYKDLSEQCSKFAVDLLNHCRNTEEVETVLVQRKGFDDPRPHKFSRLHLAVQRNQKEFVTHPSCQQVLRSMWVDGLGSWYCWSFRERVFHVIKHVIIAPFIGLLFIFKPKADVVYPLCVPLNRFIYAVTAYLVFLSFLIVLLFSERTYDLHYLTTWIEGAVCCFVLASSLSIASNILSLGIINYFRSFWSAFDFIMYSLFCVAEGLWFTTFVYNFLTTNNHFSPYNRMKWPWYHLIPMGEGIYAAASVMAFSRLLLWCHINSRVGPLGICIKYMIVDVIQFFMVFFIVMFAFATGLNSIYKNYKHSSRIEGGEPAEQQPEAFLTLGNTFKSLFWAIFALGEPDYANIIVAWNTNQNDLDDTEYRKHYFTEGVGYGLWGLYHLVTVVVLLNMLIAMMAESYQRVQNNADLEWKFACSTSWLTGFDSHMTALPPFNLVPFIHRFLVILRRRITKKTRRTSADRSSKIPWSMKLKRFLYGIKEPNPSISKTEEEEYEKLMVQLIRRYLDSNDLWETSSASNIPAEVKEKLKCEILQELRQSANLPSRRMTVRGRAPEEPRAQSQ